MAVGPLGIRRGGGGFLYPFQSEKGAVHSLAKTSIQCVSCSTTRWQKANVNCCQPAQNRTQRDDRFTPITPAASLRGRLSPCQVNPSPPPVVAGG